MKENGIERELLNRTRVFREEKGIERELHARLVAPIGSYLIEATPWQLTLHPVEARVLPVGTPVLD